MDNFFDGCVVPEASSLLGFSGNKITSHAEGRTTAHLSAALDDNNSRYILVCEGNVLVHETAKGATSLLEVGELEPFSPDFTNAIVPGNLEGTPVIGVPGVFDPEDIASPYQALDARSVLFSSQLNACETGAIGMAISLLHWHKNNQHCGVCGAPSRSRIGGMRRDCSQCSSQIFPRTDPVVIMLAVRGDKCLLGRGPHFPPNWYSCLAGFVEPGETIEQAVRRETIEESGIEIGRVKYFASQPWPFPHSLMIGAYCEAISDEVFFDGEELEDCRWFGREEVLSMIEKRHKTELRAPPSKSIAAHIIGNWLNKTG